MTSATDELRRMLDERGVEWSSPSGLNSSFADSITFIGDVAVVSEIDGSDLLRINFDGTPEQAIAATLGATDARPTQVESSGTCHDIGTFKSWGLFTCSNCSIVIPLNAAKDAPEVGKSVPLNYCPNCGAKVLDPTINDVDAEATNG